MDKIEKFEVFSQPWEQDLVQVMSLRLVTKKLVLMTDTDVDGAHIQPNSCLTLIYHYMKPILEAGYVCPTTDLWVKVEVRSKYIQPGADQKLNSKKRVTVKEAFKTNFHPTL